MANTNTPFGFRPVANVNASPLSGGVNLYSTATGDSTAIYIGDAVVLAGTGQTINGQYYADVTRAANTDVILGIVVGVLNVTQASTIYREASTQRILLVSTDPSAEYIIQEGGSGTALTLNDVGLNINFTVVAGSNYTGLSGTILDNTTEATTNTLPLQLVGLANIPGNEVGYYAKWVVRLNRVQFANQVAGV